jgi:flagellar basal body P-ring formation protein FlgA
VQLQEQAKVQNALVTIGDLARVSGGDAAIREQIERLDVADLKSREQNVSITRRVIEYRLRLAGLDSPQVQIVGADRTTISLNRRQVLAEEVVAVAREELLRRLAMPEGSVTVELARQVVVRLPEVPVSDVVRITAAPHAKTVGLGRAQMDVVISSGAETLLALGVDLEAKLAGASPDPRAIAPSSLAQPATQPIARPGQVMQPPVQPATVMPATNAVVPAAGAEPINPKTVLIHARQRVMMQVKMGALNVSAVGEAQQEGKFGQIILVQNVDSKKSLNARVTGPGTVEVDLDPH